MGSTSGATRTDDLAERARRRGGIRDCSLGIGRLVAGLVQAVLLGCFSLAFPIPPDRRVIPGLRP